MVHTNFIVNTSDILCICICSCMFVSVIWKDIKLYKRSRYVLVYLFARVITHGRYAQTQDAKLFFTSSVFPFLHVNYFWWCVCYKQQPASFIIWWILFSILPSFFSLILISCVKTIELQPKVFSLLFFTLLARCLLQYISLHVSMIAHIITFVRFATTKEIYFCCSHFWIK